MKKKSATTKKKETCSLWTCDIFDSILLLSILFCSFGKSFRLSHILFLRLYFLNPFAHCFVWRSFSSILLSCYLFLFIIFSFFFLVRLRVICISFLFDACFKYEDSLALCCVFLCFESTYIIYIWNSAEFLCELNSQFANWNIPIHKKLIIFRFFFLRTQLSDTCITLL